MNHNGHRPAFPLPDVPIIGQHHQLAGVITFTTLVCTCEGVQILNIVGLGAPAVCHRCKRAYVITAVHLELGKPPRIELEIGVAASAPEPATS